MAEWIIEDNSIKVDNVLLNVPYPILQIMKRRGVNEDDFFDFLSDNPKVSYDPFLLADLREICIGLKEEALLGKKICIYGDYDADGVTSTALMYLLLSNFTDKLSYFIPSRFTDGYGPNKNALKKIRDDGAEVLITVDCGITSRDEIEYAKELGLKCFVSDHHILRDGMMPECLVVNPHREDSDYPYRDLSGCGVAFKIAQGMQRLFPEYVSKSTLHSYLDLVAISTIADVVPLTGENRCLVKYGLMTINKKERKGLEILISLLERNYPLSSDDISFYISPHINALGRVYKADPGVELLISKKSDTELFELAKYVVETNLKRKAIQEETSKICYDTLENEYCGEFAPVILADGAHEGVAGIVAGSLKEDLQKPICILIKDDNGDFKGSGRSIAGINLHDCFERCGDVFARFGGHAGACGFTVKKDRLDDFRSRLQEIVKENYENDKSIFDKKIYIEKELNKNELNVDFANWIKKLAPFGELNSEPVFCIRDVKLISSKLFGMDDKHWRFDVLTEDSIKIGCTYFKARNESFKFKCGQIVDIVGNFSANEFKGYYYLNFKILDIKEKR